MTINKHLIVIGGPTASGKTKMAISLAKHFRTGILSADSRQFYKEMNIGTAKPSAEELAAAPHYFINSLSVNDPYTVNDYEKEALSVLKEIFSENDVAILAGGSGMFIKAVCEGLDTFPEVTQEARREVEQFYENKGLEGLQSELEKLDPAYFKTVDLQNSRRLLRALMVCKSSGNPYSSYLTASSKTRPFHCHFICLNMDRALLYARINTRVDRMMENGLLEEAKALFEYRSLPALQTVGYAELFDHFAGIQDLGTSVELIKRNSRRYAKRQLTWFRRAQHWEWFHPDEITRIIDYVEALIKKKETK